MKHLTAVVILSLAAVVAGVQTGRSQSRESKAEQAPTPSQGPRIERSSSGVVVIRGSSAATQAARAEAATQAEEAQKVAEQPEPQAEAGAEQAQQPERSKACSVEAYTYVPGSRWVQSVTASENNTASGRSSTQTIVGTGGRQIPYISTQERIVTKTANHSVVERQVQRYNTEGQPTRQALVREEERKLPDGTTEKTTTVYEEDVNGRMSATERTVARESQSGNKMRTVVTTERPSPEGGFETVERSESTETRRGENAAVVETVVSRPNVNGGLIESKRERSVTEKSGNTATTETEVYERSTEAGEVSLSQRAVGKLVERPDGSATETIQVYGYVRPGGAASDVNAGSQPRLVEMVQRDVSVRPNGEKVETTTQQTRSIADPNSFGQQEVVQKVIRPTADGEAVETHVYEQDVNGRMRATQTVVEQVKK